MWVLFKHGFVKVYVYIITSIVLISVVDFWLLYCLQVVILIFIEHHINLTSYDMSLFYLLSTDEHGQIDTKFFVSNFFSSISKWNIPQVFTLLEWLCNKSLLPFGVTFRTVDSSFELFTPPLYALFVRSMFYKCNSKRI